METRHWERLAEGSSAKAAYRQAKKSRWEATSSRGRKDWGAWQMPQGFQTAGEEIGG